MMAMSSRVPTGPMPGHDERRVERGELVQDGQQTLWIAVAEVGVGGDKQQIADKGAFAGQVEYGVAAGVGVGIGDELDRALATMNGAPAGECRVGQADRQGGQFLHHPFEVGDPAVEVVALQVAPGALELRTQRLKPGGGVGLVPGERVCAGRRHELAGGGAGEDVAGRGEGLVAPHVVAVKVAVDNEVGCAAGELFGAEAEIVRG